MRLVAWLALVSALAALSLASRATGSRPPDDFVYRYDYAVSGLASYALLLALVLALTIGVPRRDVLALHAPQSWVRALALAAGALVVVFVGAYAAVRATGAGDEQNLAPEGWDGSRAGAYAVSAVSVVLLAPVAEELLYRGVGLTLLRARFGTGIAVAATAVLFGLGHGLVLSLAAFVWFGVVVALVRLRTGSIYPPILVHSAFNAIGITVPLFA